VDELVILNAKLTQFSRELDAINKEEEWFEFNFKQVKTKFPNNYKLNSETLDHFKSIIKKFPKIEKIYLESRSRSELGPLFIDNAFLWYRVGGSNQNFDNLSLLSSDIDIKSFVNALFEGMGKYDPVPSIDQIQQDKAEMVENLILNEKKLFNENSNKTYVEHQISLRTANLRYSQLIQNLGTTPEKISSRMSELLAKIRPIQIMAERLKKADSSCEEFIISKSTRPKEPIRSTQKTNSKKSKSAF
jgi:hypothetical protein